MSEKFDRYALYVKIYGERNSGTNFIERLVRRNFNAQLLQSNNHIYGFLEEVEPQLPKDARGPFRSRMLDLDCQRIRASEFGWKHGCVVLDSVATAPHAPRTLFICITKHPVFWLNSLLRRPYNPVERPPKEFSDFIRYDWLLTDRDNVPGAERMNVVELWNRKTRSYLELKKLSNNVLLQRYEMLLTEPMSFLETSANYLLRKEDPYIVHMDSTKKDDATFESYKAKYDASKLRDVCSKQDFDFIMERIDPDILKAVGYTQ